MTRREIFVGVSALLLALLAKVFEFVALPVRMRPDLLVVLAAAAGWLCDLWPASLSGFALGILEDAFTGRALGSRTVSLTVAACLSSLLKRFISPDSAISKIFAGVVCATASDVAGLAALRAMGINVGFLYFTRSIWPATAVWCALLAVPADFVVARMSRVLLALWPAEKRGREATA
jgi:rod shape-determining protein MreD